MPAFKGLRRERKPGGRKLTYSLMLLCLAAYVFELLYSMTYGSAAMSQLFHDYGFSLSSFLDGKFWTPVTSIFLHASPDHLVLNLIALFFFGSVIEENMGKAKFLLIFFTSAFVGTAAVAACTLLGIMPAGVPTIGASAAIFGLMGTAMLVKPFEMVFYPYIIPVPLIMVALIYTLYNVGAFIAMVATGVETEVAYAAHIGGLLSGAFFGFREEGAKRSVMVLLLILIMLLLIPLFYSFLDYLRIFDYMDALAQVFGKV
ncbi:MAG: rhomboid family intramembrane serine protease [Candidatus Aenigmatarchaeota archaeon]